MPKNIQEKVEDRIIDSMILSSGSRLVVFKPVPDGRQAENSKIDLIVEKRGDYKKKGISFKIFGKDSLLEDDDFGVTIDSGADFYLFAYFDLIKQEIEDDIWIIPAKELGKINKINPKKENNFGKFMANKKNLGDIVIEKLSDKK